MDKIWTSAKVKIRNRLDFIHYGQRIGYINIVAIVIDLAILLYSAIDYQTLMQTGNLFLFLFLVFTTLIWQTICFVKDFYAYTHKTEYYNLQDIYRHKTPRQPTSWMRFIPPPRSPSRAPYCGTATT